MSEDVKITVPAKTSGLAVAALITGIIGLLLSAVPIINNFAFVLAIFAFVCGLIAKNKIKKGKAAGNGIATAAIVLAVITAVVVLASQAFYGKAVDEVGKSIDESIANSSGENTDDLLANDVSVEIGTFTVVEEEYITNTKLPVKVTNKHAEKKSYSIQIEAVDASGARIDDDTVYANDLNPGQSQSFDAFIFITSDKIETFKAATFKVLTVSQY